MLYVSEADQDIFRMNLFIKILVSNLSENNTGLLVFSFLNKIAASMSH